MAERKKRMTKAEIQRRDAEIVLMKRNRVPFTQIAEKFGVSDVRCGQIYRAALAANPLMTMQVDEHRMEELELIEMATLALLRLARSTERDQRGNAVVSPRTKVEAWSAIRAWAEHKAKLFGLYAPIKAEVMTMGYLDAKIIELEASLGLAPGEEIPDFEGV